MKKTIYGLSLIELLVSIAISGIILAGVVNVVVSSKVTFIAEEENSFIQENARYVMETLTRDARLAGSTGCASLSTALVGNTISDDNEGGILNFSAVDGFEGGTSAAKESFPDRYKDEALVGSDSIIFRYADDSSAVEISSHELASSTINTTSNTNLSWDKDDALVVVDLNCRHVSLFRATSDTTSGQHISHKSNGAGDRNCTSVLKATISNFDCSSCPSGGSTCDGNPESAFGVGSRVMAFVANSYYIGESNVLPGVPSLKRVTLTGSTMRTDELAQGVESMNILYGEDINGDGDIQKFVTADNVTDWSNVLAVRFYLTFRSQIEFYDSDYEITLNGVDYDDRYLRQIANVTVRLRNR